MAETTTSGPPDARTAAAPGRRRRAAARTKRLAPARNATGRRHLHLGHFAFMRAVVQGLPADAVWERYLAVEGEHSDARLVRATIAWIRAEFAAAARRESRPALARLLRLELERLVDATPTLPTLAQFAEEAGLEDASEREHIEAYEQRYGRATARATRRAWLLRRQLDALRWLEQLVARRPAPGDPVSAWLRPELAARLEASNIFTVAQLAARINGIGVHWARSIRGVGAIKARRIVQWINEHAESIGVWLGAHTSVPRSRLPGGRLHELVAPATDVRPIEKLIVPEALNGSRGAYRRAQLQCLLAATNDLEAIVAWLRSKRGAAAPARGPETSHEGRADAGTAGSTVTGSDAMNWLAANGGSLSHTQRAYRKEAERFLLWAIVERRKPLSSMTAEDCAAYVEFLANPAPRSRWCGSRARARWSPMWRPLEGPLSAAAQRQAIVILKNLYGFLVAQNYLMGNPFTSVAVPRATKPSLDVGRSLTQDQWAFVRDAARGEGAHSAAQRLRFALDLLYATGLRASEAVAATLADLEAVEYADGEGGTVRGHMLQVLGKGQKLRQVPVPEEVVHLLDAYLASRGLQPFAAAARDESERRSTYLLGVAADAHERAPALRRERPLDARAGVHETTLYAQLKAFFGRCADALMAAGDSAGAQRLSRASTHWLRHTHATHALAKGVPVDVAQHNLGHASLATTSMYVSTERARRLQKMQGFWQAANRSPLRADESRGDGPDG